MVCQQLVREDVWGQGSQGSGAGVRVRVENGTVPVSRVMTPPGSMIMLPAGMMPAGIPAAALASTGPLQTAVSISGHTVQSQYSWGPPVSVNHLSHQSHSPPTPFQDVRLQMQDGSLAGPGQVDDIASPRRCKHYRAFIPFVGWSPCPLVLFFTDPVGALLCWGFFYLLASPLLVGLVFVGLGIAGAVINGSPALWQVVAGPILCVVGVITCCMIPWRTCSDHCEDCFEEFEPDPFP